MSLIDYTKGTPNKTGVYAVRTPMDEAPDLLEDRFLLWFEGKWWYPRSDQRYRGEVMGFVGPLARRIK